MLARLRKCITAPRALFLAAAALATVALATPARADVTFETDINKALARAKREGKPIMIDVYTDWCGWCHKLDKDVYARKDVADYINKNYVALKVNPEKDKKSADFVNRYKVEGYPTIIITNTSGKEVDRIVGYRGPDEFLKTAKQMHAKAAPKKAAPKRRT